MRRRPTIDRLNGSSTSTAIGRTWYTIASLDFARRGTVLVDRPQEHLPQFRAAATRVSVGSRDKDATSVHRKDGLTYEIEIAGGARVPEV